MKSVSGLSLIELVVAVSVVLILAAIATPIYRHFIDKARMAEGESAVLELQSVEERHFSSTQTYSTDLAVLGFSPTPPLKYYVMEVRLGDMTGENPIQYQAVALPKVAGLHAWYLTVYADGTHDLWHETVLEQVPPSSGDPPPESDPPPSPPAKKAKKKKKDN